MKTGLALGGGGSKGIFQIGAWQAFRELGVRFDVVTGTSIGSINGAFMACDDYDGADRMWQNLQIDQCLAFSENRPLKSDDLLSRKNANLLAHELLRQHSLDTGPLRQMLGQYIQEDRVRQSPIQFGLMTALLPSLTPQPRWIGDIPDGQLVDFLMASSGLPGLRPVKIGGRRFIDGGVVENVPVSMLRDLGLFQITAIDLGAHASIHSPLLDSIQLTYIHDRQDLGGTLDTSKPVLVRNRRLGYLDTLKAYGRLSGDYFAFEPAEHRELCRRFGAENTRGLEQAALAYEIDRLPVYGAGEFVDAVRQRRREAQQVYDARREALQIDNKFRALINGRLKVLDLLPPMRLAFLMEISARARQAGSRIKIPAALFPNLDLAARALLLLEP